MFTVTLYCCSLHNYAIEHCEVYVVNTIKASANCYFVSCPRPVAVHSFIMRLIKNDQNDQSGFGTTEKFELGLLTWNVSVISGYRG
jgi:hypothetical protein